MTSQLFLLVTSRLKSSLLLLKGRICQHVFHVFHPVRVDMGVPTDDGGADRVRCICVAGNQPQFC
jgi:hypothetical protein